MRGIGRSQPPCRRLVHRIGVAGLGLLLGPRALPWACGLAGALAWCVWVPLLPALTEALGLDALVLGALTGWTWTAASPALADRPGERHAAYLTGLLVLAAVALGVAAATAPRVAIDLMNRPASVACSCIRTRSPRIAPPVNGDDGSIASTATSISIDRR